MSEATLDEKIEFATWVLAVMRKRHDFESDVMAGHRDLIQRTFSVDPTIRNANLTIALMDVGSTVQTGEQRAALLELFQATLHMWYRVSPEFKGWIEREFVLSAMLRGDDKLSAEISFDKITETARSYGEVSDERDALARTERLKRQLVHDANDFEKAKAERLH